MNPIILLGAGFSRNWGGFLAKEAFEYLLGCPEIDASDRLKSLLWEHDSAGGFEGVLEHLQMECIRDPSRPSSDLVAFQAAVARMFADMDRGYANLATMEFQNDQQWMIRTFLLRFQAIFSLNQDSLLERHYLNDNVMLGSSGRWNGWQIPSMRLDPASLTPLQPRATGIWRPTGELPSGAEYQPLYKLHGSANWRDATNSAFMIIGGFKEEQISANPILAKYGEAFRLHLSKPHSRLVVIGYGFRDHHINKMIAHAVYNHGLRFFVVCPEGSKIARTLRSDVHPGAALIAYGYDLEDVFARGCAGISSRMLRETFGGDSTEHGKLLRFLS